MKLSNSRHLRWAMAFLMGLCISPCFAEAPTLLILPFENATGQAGYKSLSKGLPDLITAFLAPHSDEIQVVEREKLESIMAEQSLKWENVTEAKIYRQLGQLVQARYILRGSCTTEKEGLKIRAFLYETDNTRLVHTMTAGGQAKQLNEMAEFMVTNLVHYVAQKSVDGLGQKNLQLPTDPDPETNLHLMYGLSYYYANQYPKAIPEFMKILIKHPRHADSIYWLGKSFHAAGMKENAAIEFKQFLEWFAKDSRVPEVKQLVEGNMKSQ